ncbi:hypothetical protein ACH5RR_012838 [Cinchona calisaya]|uniref:Uncharacterized protein n=1 Tax=Cinchona calisaya TaxID=153742 RepID=A0ABD3ACG2_9GENT
MVLLLFPGMMASTSSTAFASFLYSVIIDATLFLFREEIDIDATALLVGKVIGVVNVELRKKKTGKLIARGRQTMYMAVPSKL